MNQPPTRRGIALLAHGSRDAAWRGPLEAIAARMRELDPGAIVACAYLEQNAPDLSTAASALLTAGAASITVWPMFLGAGRHARLDMPRLMEQLRQQHPNVPMRLAPAIGTHPGVLEAMARAALGGD